MHRTVVLNVVGLTRSLLGSPLTPSLNRLCSSCIPIRALLPAVTCPVQSTYLTGQVPAAHGIVANGWYDRGLGEVHFWKQSNQLVQGDKIWHEARRRDPACTVANSFWWFAMNGDSDWTVTPRPVYCADGSKIPDCYTAPPELRRQFTRELGPFPLFQFWGPATAIRSSEWIAAAAMALENQYRPTLQLVYLPHLDYCLQKYGPNGAIDAELQAVDRLCGRLLDYFSTRGCRLIVLSEYGVTPVSRPIHPNRLLRQAGFLALKVDLGREYLDPATSAAFAVADHQVAHVYIRDRGNIPAVRELLSAVPGIERVMAAADIREAGLGHQRSGELLLVAAADSWFTYYWWHDDARAPDYARTVNIHAKPGYDPCELFLDPQLALPKAKIAWALAKKAMGFRSLMEVIPLDATLVKGSHGRPTDHHEAGPLFMTSEPRFLPGSSIMATDVYHLLLDHLFRD